MASSSIYKYGSGEVFEFECDSCKYDGDIQEGKGYCVQCDENLCENCLNVHKKSKVSRSHVIQSCCNLLHSQRLNTGQDSNTQYCYIHTHKAIQYYCTEHDEVACMDCKIIDHRTCAGVLEIADICKVENVSRQLDHVEQELQQCLNQLQKMQQQRKQGIQDLDNQGTQCFRQIQAIRDQINQLLDKLENEARSKVTQTVEKEKRKLQDHATSMDTMVTDLEKGEKSVKAARQSGDNNMFIAWKRLRFEKKRKATNDIEKEMQTARIDFEADIQLTNILRVLKQFGEENIERTSTRTDPTDRNDTDVLLDQQYQSVQKHNIRCSKDTRTCSIRGLTSLQDGRVLLIDSSNFTLKLFSADWMLQDSITLYRQQPWGITMSSPTQAVVTLLMEKKLQFVTVGKQLLLGQQIRVDKICWDVVHKDGNLYVSCQDTRCCGDLQGEIQVHSMTGMLLRRVGNTGGTCMFHNPISLTVNKDNIYVCDVVTKTLTCITEQSQVVYSYTHKDLRDPKGFTVDSKQNVYICDYESNNIQVINCKGEKVKTLLDVKDGLKSPVALMYRDTDKSLIVGNDLSDEIIVYKYK